MNELELVEVFNEDRLLIGCTAEGGKNITIDVVEGIAKVIQTIGNTYNLHLFNDWTEIHVSGRTDADDNVIQFPRGD